MLQKIDYEEAKLPSNPSSYRFNSWMNRLLKQCEKMMLFNQKYWGDLSRKEWLINSNRNSKYFQTKR